MDNSSVFPHGIKTGVIAGVAAILVTLLAYVLNINMLGWTFQGVSYLVLIGVMIYGLLGFRKANGGYMAFAQGILIVLVAGMICAIINYFFGRSITTSSTPDSNSKSSTTPWLPMKKWASP